MLNFDYENKTRIIFGDDTHKTVGEILKPYASKVLLHYGGGSIKRTGVYDDVVKSLELNNIEYIELGGVKPNPRLSLVNEGINLCKKENVDFILAVGGGSVIDSAKTIALGVKNEGDVWDFFLTNKDNKGALPIATILTIPAAGSEASSGAVITNMDKELKLSYGRENLRPIFSIINPKLYYTLPENQIANGVCDMMIHIMERYFTNTKNTELIDGLCESTLKTIMKNALILKEDNHNYEAWSEIAIAGTIAHNGLLGIGRQQDWSSHDIEHELSAIYDIAHGAGLAVVTPAWMTHVYKTNVDIFVQFAINVMGVDVSYRDSDKIVLEGIKRLKNFFKEMGLPTRLEELNIDDSKFEEMAKKATNFENGSEVLLGGVKKLNWEDVLYIYKLAL